MNMSSLISKHAKKDSPEVATNFTSGLREEGNEVIHGIVGALAEKYGFDVEEAMAMIEIDIKRVGATHSNEMAAIMEHSPITTNDDYDKSSTGQQTDGLTSNKLSKLKCHNDFKRPETQLEFYIKNNTSEEILPYVDLQGKTFGEKHMEKIAKEYFNLGDRISSTHDHTKCGKTLEQKSARYHANGDDWKWQHIEMTHKWDYLLLCGLDFKDIKFYIASRKIVETLIADGIITGQGKKKDGIAQPQQAYWFSRSNFAKHGKIFTDYFVEITNECYMVKYLNSF